MIVIDNNVWARFTSASEAERAQSLLSFKPRGYRFSPAYKDGRWDGNISLLRAGDLFPAGLASYVADRLGLRVENNVARPAPTLLMGAKAHPAKALDQAQEEAVAAAVAATRGIIQYPTGSGKSLILCETVWRLGVRVLILCDKRDLLRQLHDYLEAYLGAPVGMVGDGSWTWLPVTVATYQTLARRLDPAILHKSRRQTLEWAEAKRLKEEVTARLAEYQAVLCDEGHHTEAKTFDAVLRQMTSAYYRLSFSATPFKSDEKADLGTKLRVIGATGPVIAQQTISEAIEETGRVVPADVFCVSIDSPFFRGLEAWERKRRKARQAGKYLSVLLNYKEEVKAGIVDHLERNEAVVALAQWSATRGPTVVLVERIEHGEHLAKELGWPFRHGGSKAKERKAAWNDFRTGTLRGLIVSKIGDEGLDLPNMRFLILAGGGRAAHRQVQRLGRGMRASEGKDRLTAFDFADGGNYLRAHYRRRRRLYDSEPAYTVADIHWKELQTWLVQNK